MKHVHVICLLAALIVFGCNRDNAISGTYNATSFVDGIPTTITFTAPGICQVTFPSGFSMTTTYKVESGGYILNTRLAISEILFARPQDGGLEITERGATVTYKKE